MSSKRFTRSSLSSPSISPVPPVLSVPPGSSSPKSSSESPPVPLKNLGPSSSKRKSIQGAKESEYKKCKGFVTESEPSLGLPFYSHDKLLRFQENVCSRPLWPEYRVKLKHFSRVRDIVQSRKWERTVTHLQSPNVNLVREFYANLDESIVNEKSQHKYQAYIRGSWFRCAPSTISLILKIPRLAHPTYTDEYKPLFKDVGAELTGKPDFVWNGKEFPVTILSEFYRVLHKIALSNWWANSHTSTINYNTARFLYALGTGVSIDLPSLIYTRILDSAKAKGVKHTLPYPSLIQRLVLRGNPAILEQDVTVPVPYIGKTFQPVSGKPIPPSVIAFSTSDPAAPADSEIPPVTTSPLSRLPSAHWQVKLLSEVRNLAHAYNLDQQRQKRFEQGVVTVLTALSEVLRSMDSGPLSEASPVQSSSSDDPTAPLQGEFGSDSLPADTAAPIQGESQSAGAPAQNPTG
ncbi:hypothetical protein CsatB_022463 [Cannabis sativa]